LGDTQRTEDKDVFEEAELPYRIIPVNIGKGDQFTPQFLAISRTIKFRRLSTLIRKPAT
jgi:hypothetical protein